MPTKAKGKLTKAVLEERARCSGLLYEASEFLRKCNRKKASVEMDLVRLAIERGDVPKEEESTPSTDHLRRLAKEKED